MKAKITLIIETDCEDPSTILDGAIEALDDIRGAIEAQGDYSSYIFPNDVSVEEIED